MALVQLCVLISSVAFVNGYLLYTEGASRFQVILGVGTPVDLVRETVIIGPFLKANYLMPTNISQWYPHNYARKKRSFSRWDVYDLLAQEAQLRGHDGRSCVLRSICEAAAAPIDHRHGFFNELFHVLFKPTSTNELLAQHSDNEYYGAEKMGINFPGKCHVFFPQCKQTFFERFTEYYDDL